MFKTCLFVLVLVVASGHSALASDVAVEKKEAPSQEKKKESKAIDPATALYEGSISEGRKAMASHDYKLAIEKFGTASKVALFEVPNYQAFVELAEAHCLNREGKKGAMLLKDFDCMLRVDSGVLKCYGKADDDIRNAGLTDRCFNTMCGEIYLSYYKNPTDESLAAIQRYRKKMERVTKTCKGSDR